jgi:type IV secretion system protein VirB6
MAAAAGPSTFSSTFFSQAYTFFDGQLNTFLNERFQNVVDAVRGPLAAAMVIYVVFYGFLIWRGKVNDATDAVWRLMRLALLFTAATTVAYKTWITDPLFNAAPTAVTQAVSGQDYKDAGSTFDKLEAKAADTYNRLRLDANTQPLTNIGAALEDVAVSLILEAVAAGACVVGFALTIFSLVGLAITIALGPIFIALSLFSWGHGFFFGWLRQAFKYIVELAVITTMAALIMSLGDSVLKSSLAADPVNQAMFLVVYYLFGAFMFFQAPSVASGITGGAGMSAGEVVAGGIAAATVGSRRLMPMAESAANSVGATGRAVGGGARAAYNRIRSRNSISR